MEYEGSVKKQLDIIASLKESLNDNDSEFARRAILESIEIEEQKLALIRASSSTSNDLHKSIGSYYNEIARKSKKSDIDYEYLKLREENLKEKESHISERLSEISKRESELLTLESTLGERGDSLIRQNIEVRERRKKLDSDLLSFESEVQTFRKEKFDFSESKVIKENAIRIIEDAYKSRQKSKDSLFQASYLYASMMMIMIFLGMFILFQVYQDSVNFYKEDINWVTAVFYILKNAFILGAYIIGLKFLANFSDKYFKAARQEEDRIHNMTYGKFYVETYASVLDTSEIKEALCGWGSKGNIDSQIKEDSIQLDSKDMKELISFLPTMKKLSETFSMSDKKSDSESDK